MKPSREAEIRKTSPWGEELGGELDRLRAELSDKAANNVGLASSNRLLRAELQRVTVELSELKDETASEELELRAGLTAALVEGIRVTAELGAAENHVDKLQEKLAGVTAERDLLAKDADKLARELAAANALADKAIVELGRARGDLAERVCIAARAKEAVDESVQLRGKLEAAEKEEKDYQQKLEVIRAEFAEIAKLVRKGEVKP
jgi:chromosome segregation ATPase